MAKPKPLSRFPRVFWQMFELAAERGSFEFQHDPADVARLRDEIYSFRLSLRRDRHPDAERYGAIQPWVEPTADGNAVKGPFTGRMILQPYDNDPRLKDLQRQVEEAGGQPATTETPPVPSPSAPSIDEITEAIGELNRDRTARNPYTSEDDT